MPRAQKLCNEKYISIHHDTSLRPHLLSCELSRIEFFQRLLLAWLRGWHVPVGEPQRIHHDVREDVRLACHHAVADVITGEMSKGEKGYMRQPRGNCARRQHEED